MKTIACFAVSLDGRTAFAHTERYQRISSDEDIRRLFALRDQVDGVLMGARTFRAYPKVHRGHTRTTPLHHFIVTRGRNLLEDIPPQSPLFSPSAAIPVTIFTGNLPDPATRSHYPDTVCWEPCPSETGEEHPVEAMLHAAAKRRFKTLLIEGGGEIFAMFLKARAVEELHLTVCPLLLGDVGTPGLVTGVGFTSQDPVPRTQILSMEPVGQEIFLRLALSYDPPP
jgi:5-amino-6-(5-phosphoribosylamino)uracil reductase